MAIAPDPHRENILAIDIGATGIKFGVVDPSGHLVEPVRRIATPYPCLPDRLILRDPPRVAWIQNWNWVLAGY